MSQTSRNEDPRAIIGRMNDRIHHPNPKITPRYLERGPENSREYRCTYYIGDTEVESGEWKFKKADATKSAATNSLPKLRLWNYQS